ncbi:dihydrolipoamide acetyltransferase family protein [Streptomyces sp. NPDC004609]|uniref:dihydrolipoamide acetyltransferase family protein n=1 Tax=Streptomyces sp. NPDC004609 TaxID=3364704 RepID=UPI0036BC148A
MSSQQFCLPDVGEGLTEADILAWHVRPGDTVEVNQIVVEIETAKAAVELPSPYAGVVAELHAAEGETVAVGRPIITVATATATAAGAPGSGAPAPAPVPAPVPEPRPSSAGTATMLVGYGPRETTAVRRRRRPLPPPGRPDGHRPPPVPVTASATAVIPAPGDGQVPARPSAKPPVRKLAKDLGVSLYSVVPTGPGGTVTREDVHRAATAAAPTHPTATVTATAERETRIRIRGVRKHTARAMSESAFTAPHVTEFVTADVTETMRLRDTVSARREFRELRPSPLVFVARALLLALGRTPEANSSWDEEAQEIVLKHYVNLGIAAATDRGLIVPNIKDAHELSLLGLAGAIAELATTARAGRTAPGDMAGGTITITNVGVFGVDTGTPILNPGEAAILAVGTVRRMPWVVGTGADERIEPRSVLQLALSFDHRLVDGRQGSRLLADTAEILSTPGLALL